MKKYTDTQLQEAVKASFSIRNVCLILELGSSGSMHKAVKAKIRYLELDTSHFTGKGWNVAGRRFNPNPGFTLDEVLVKNKHYCSSALKRKLLKHGVKERRCESCQMTNWLSKPIPLELHHLDGDSLNNTLENLQLLCPNCHAMTDNYRGKNRKTL